MQIVTEVAAKVPLQMVARLAPRDLVSLQAMRMSSAKWTTVGPLSADREGYWGTLAHTTAFLSTATAEAYGLEELEALVAGVIGVMPKLPGRGARPDGVSLPLQFRRRGRDDARERAA